MAGYFSCLGGTLAVGLLLSGCASVPEYYQPSAPVVDMAIGDSLYVALIECGMPKELEMGYDPNSDPMILIPLLPYSKSELNPMVKHNFFQMTLAASLHRLIVKDLRKSGLFKEIYYHAAPDQLGVEIPASSRTLRLRLTESVWRRYLTAYGLSYPGTFLWLLGLPVSYGNVNVTIEAKLYDSSAADAKLLGSREISRRVACTEWIYEQVGYEPAKSEKRLSEILPLIAEDLREFILQTAAE